jgi:malonate-semialdehyde dehydrogenase (acetylating)/methylmalonate-semialdehyde dehydrogenase
MSAVASMRSGMKTVEHFIGGRHTPGSGTRTGAIYDPASGEETARVRFAERADVDAAVASAAAALPGWAATTPLRRARVLFAYRALLEKHADALAESIVREHGKVLSDARGEVTRGLEVVEFACGIPHLLKGEFSENAGPAIDSYSLRQPLGVCAGITPFNFPVMVPMWMFPLAVACGNTFVLKPSERDPSPSLRIAELFIEAGAPPGVLNVVQGDKLTVAALLEHPDIKAVSFVGSTPIARSIYVSAAQHGKRVQALGGAKNHAVVLPDADLDEVVEALTGAAYGSAGERCMAISVAVAVGAIGDALVERLAKRARSLKIRAGSDPDAEMGPLVTREHLQRVRDYIDGGVAEGAELILDGRERVIEESGFFIGATIFDRVSPEMAIYRDEIFGPVLSVVRAADLQHAIELVNANRYGNGVALFTRSGGAAREFVSRVNIGMVGVNVAIPVPMAFHSFGGWKESMFGDRAVYGTEGVEFYTRLKTVTARWPTSEPAAGDAFAMPTH